MAIACSWGRCRTKQLQIPVKALELPLRYFEMTVRVKGRANFVQRLIRPHHQKGDQDEGEQGYVDLR